jgi:hypothetical protein
MSTYTLISSQVLSSSAASVTFSSIPSTYKDLVLRVSSRETAGSTTTTFFVRYNGDSSTIYSDTVIYGQGSTGAGSYRNSSGGSTGNELGLDPANTATSNTFGNTEIYIPNYTSSNKKVSSGFNAAESNTASGTEFNAAVASLYQGTSAITSITLLGASFAAGSSFYLYGI